MAKKRAWIERLVLAESLPAGYAAMAADTVAELASRIGALGERLDRPVVIGICGAQGAGKSTLAIFLANWLAHESGLAAVRVSLDDFYFGRQIRGTLAASVHPLLATRGVPGTHDVELCRRTLAALVDGSEPGTITLPYFDKASDDRIAGAGTAVRTPVDVVLFEGWCVGATAQAPEALADPVNALEANADLTGTWRRYVNDRLADDYAELFANVDALIMFRVPSFDKVFEWRLQQERQLAGSAMNEQALAVFIMHYERLTRHMLDTMPGYADTVIDIDTEHRFVAMRNDGWGEV